MSAKVRHAHLWGRREILQKDSQGKSLLAGGKYHWLLDHELSSSPWKKLQPQTPFYLFVPQDIELRKEYNQGWRINEGMPVNGVGMTTARDHVVIDFQKEPILERAKLFRDSHESDKELCELLSMPMKKGWNIRRSRQLIAEVKNLESCIKPILYRPFDSRLIFYHDSLVWRTVKQIMQHMLPGYNVGLITTRQTRDLWDVFITEYIIGHKSLAAYDINSLFPLYLYPKPEREDLFDVEAPTEAPGGRRPNLAPEFIEDFSGRLKLKFIPDGKGDRRKTFGPEDVFDYIYALFHSPAYRKRYAEFLKIDFPRLPLTTKPELFRALCALGERLVALHLMEADIETISTYPEAGDDTVEKVRFTLECFNLECGSAAAALTRKPKQATTLAKKSKGRPSPSKAQAPLAHSKEMGRVWINKKQYFEGVPPEVWQFHVGGYQVCHKWLKDRKGRRLSYDDITHYQRIVAALSETIRLMSEIDAVIDAHGGWPVC